MTIGRPRQFDENESLDQAMLQFWQHGYASTSMNDLMNCTGMSKSSIYSSFGNKSALFNKCLSRFKNNLIADFDQQLSTTESGLQFIQDLLEKIISEADKPKRKGCLLVNTANELAGQDQQLAELVNCGFIEIRDFFNRALIKAKQMNELSIETDTELLADFILSGVLGLRTLVKSGADRQRLQQVTDMLMSNLK